jgi:two-component system cell cycle response regulator
MNANELKSDLQDTIPRILIADDSISAIYSLEWVLLNNITCKVISAKNVEDAIKAAIEEHPDLAILDMKMPKNVKAAGLLNQYAGADICKELRSHPLTRDIPVIMLTVTSESEGRPESLKAGANEYLTKPFNSEALLQIVNRYLKS